MSNWSGEDSIPKLQPEAGRSNNVLLDGTAAPRAAIDTHPLRRCSLSVEPSTPNPKMPTAKRPKPIKRIPRPNHHKVARAKVLLSDHLKRTRVVGNCFQCLGDGGHCLFSLIWMLRLSTHGAAISISSSQHRRAIAPSRRRVDSPRSLSSCARAKPVSAIRVRFHVH